MYPSARAMMQTFCRYYGPNREVQERNKLEVIAVKKSYGKTDFVELEQKILNKFIRRHNSSSIDVIPYYKSHGISILCEPYDIDRIVEGIINQKIQVVR